MKIGYARVSTVEQDLETQTKKLLDLGVAPERIYVDHGFTGKTMTREGLTHALAACREGDQLVVPSLDRLARNALSSQQIMLDLEERGITLNNGGIIYDPNDPMAKLFFGFLAHMAEAEGGWISIRTKEAMARPSVRAKLNGKKPKLTPTQDAAIARHKEEGEQTVAEIANLFNITRPGVYRAVARHKERHGEATGASLTAANAEGDQ